MKFVNKYGQWLKKGEHFEIFMDPLIYATLNNIDDEELLVYILQDELHFLLNSFLDPLELSNVSKVTYPIKSDVQQAVKNKVYLLCNYIRKYIKYLPISTTTLNKFNGYLQTVQKPLPLSKLISTLYRELLESIESYEAIHYNTVTLEPIDNKLYMSNNFLKPIYLLHNYLEKRKVTNYLKCFILHGSLATLDYVEGWSDVDTYVIVRSNIVIDHKQLLKLRKLLFDIFKYFTVVDPYQHHGVFVCTELDTEFYPQAYLPFEVLKHSKLVIGESELSFKERNENLECLMYFWRVVQVIRNAYFTKFPFKNYYFAKLFLAYLMLLPTYYLQAKGIHVYKKYSFELVGKEGLKGWRSVEMASYLREKYTQRRALPISICAVVNSLLKNPLWDLFFHYFIKNKNKFDKCYLNMILQDSILLTEEMCKNVWRTK
ncbi:MAG: hypothetical protein ACTSVW_04910 [Candidatus Njordarchaeales archaeon]